MRTPTISVPSRTPTISPSIAARVSPSVTRAVSVGPGPRAITTARISARTVPRPVLPYARYSPNLYPACTAPYRDADGECLAQPNTGGDGAGKSGKKSAGKGRGNNTPVAANLRTFANEFVAEIDSALSATEADELARRHGLTRVSSENFPLIGATIGLFRITDGRPFETVRREFAADGSVRSVQPNFRYVLQDQKSSVADRGRSRAIRAGEAPPAASAHAGAWRQRHGCRDRFRHRRQASRTRQFHRRQFRCAWQHRGLLCLVLVLSSLYRVLK